MISEPVITFEERTCIREAIPEIALAAQHLDAAVSAHLSGQRDLAASLIRQANMPEIREWTESIWGSASPYIKPQLAPNSPPHLPRHQRVAARMPNLSEKQLLHERDGFHCRFCGIPLIRAEIRQAMQQSYPNELPWGRKNAAQHAAFQAMWLQYDHLLPHARGGSNDFSNLLVTCAPCNFGRMNMTVEEIGLADPRKRDPSRSSWDGLERFLSPQQSGAGEAIQD